MSLKSHGNTRRYPGRLALRHRARRPDYLVLPLPFTPLHAVVTAIGKVDHRSDGKPDDEAHPAV